MGNLDDEIEVESDNGQPGDFTNDLQMSDIRMDKKSDRYDGEGDEYEMAEMEKQLKSEYAIAGNKNIGNTLKNIRGEIEAEDDEPPKILIHQVAGICFN